LDVEAYLVQAIHLNYDRGLDYLGALGESGVRCGHVALEDSKWRTPAGVLRKQGWTMTLTIDEDAGGVVALHALRGYSAKLAEAFGKGAFRRFSWADMQVFKEHQVLEERIPWSDTPRWEGDVKLRELGDVGYCGLVCVVCSHVSDGCQGCRSGGGDEECHQRVCCTGRGLQGCWQCGEFPCDKGYFAEPAWQGLCRGFTQVIRDQGPEALVRLVMLKLGQTVEYGDYRFMPSDGIEEILSGE
jgi:hypothetical protein